MRDELELSVGEFVAVLNQTLEYAYNSVVIYGELANFHINRDRWVYFDLKDNDAKVSFFGSKYVLPGPLEDGMMLKVRGTPRLHPAYGFSVNVSAITPMGEGSIKRLSELLRRKLEAEGLFAPERKRALIYPPTRIGLIAALHSAAFIDFTKILNDRWGGIEIDALDSAVQGDGAPGELIRAIEYFSAMPDPPEVLVIVRGGGSPEDLAAFNNEQVTRAVAASRVPTLVAIGHERDECLAELAADRRASTPSNAAEILVPDKKHLILTNKQLLDQMYHAVEMSLGRSLGSLKLISQTMPAALNLKLEHASDNLTGKLHLLNALSPKKTLDRGYAIIRSGGRVSDGSKIRLDDIVDIETAKARFEAKVTGVKNGKH